jgi:hypothetical protein
LYKCGIDWTGVTDIDLLWFYEAVKPGNPNVGWVVYEDEGAWC